MPIIREYKISEEKLLEELTELEPSHIYYCYYKLYTSDSNYIYDLIEDKKINKDSSILYTRYSESDLSYSEYNYYYTMFIFPNCKNLDLNKALKMKVFL